MSDEEKIVSRTNELRLVEASAPGETFPAEDGLECSIYQNYSASEVFVQGLAGVVNQQDVEAMIRAQKKMLQRFEKTNEMLSNCNSLSATRLERATRDFKAHTQYINGLKKDLDLVFRRIRSLKARVKAQHPEAFEAIDPNRGQAVKEEDDEYDEAIKERKRTQDQRETRLSARSISPIAED